MQGINKVFLLGEVVGEPSVKDTSSSSVANLRMKTTESFVNRDGEHKEMFEFHNIVLWGKKAHDLDGLREGDVIVVDGKISTRSYEKDGERKWITEVKAVSVDLVKSGAAKQPEFDDQDSIPF